MRRLPRAGYLVGRTANKEIGKLFLAENITFSRQKASGVDDVKNVDGYCRMHRRRDMHGASLGGPEELGDCDMTERAVLLFRHWLGDPIDGPAENMA